MWPPASDAGCGTSPFAFPPGPGPPAVDPAPPFGFPPAMGALELPPGLPPGFGLPTGLGTPEQGPPGFQGPLAAADGLLAPSASFGAGTMGLGPVPPGMSLEAFDEL